MKKQNSRVNARLRHRARAQMHRGLRMEMLEGRRVMAADPLALHNNLIAEDVNKDFQVSPLDALLVINALNNRNKIAAESEPGARPRFIDVSGDGVVSPLDALLVINQLNAEGEGTALISYTLQVTDANFKDNNNNGEYDVGIDQLGLAPVTSIEIGKEFIVKVFVQDLRTTGATGVAAAGFDLDVVGSETETNLVQFPNLDSTLLASTSQLLGTSALGAVGSDEEIDELSVFMGLTPPANPTAIQPVIYAKFKALKAGEVSFGLNAADTSGAETIFFNDETAIPTTSLMFPSTFAKLTIIADPTAPVAVNDTATTEEDKAIILAGAGSTLVPALTANDTKFTGRQINVTSLSLIPSVTKGTINGLTYTPPANFFGTDTIRYTITDTNGLTSSATVTINVTPVNDAPTAVNDPATGAFAGTENEPVTIAITTLLANDSPGPNESSQTLSIQSVSTTSGTVAVVGSNVVYTPADGATGEQTFSYVVTDNGSPALTATATVKVNLEPATRPFARRDTASTTEISAGQAQTGIAINVLANDAVNPGATPILLSFAATSTGGGTITKNADNTLQYVPAFEFNGTDFFTYTLSDSAGTGVTSTATVTVNVADVNDAPTAGNDTIPASASILEDTPVTIAISTLLANDSPGLGETNTQTLTVTPGTSASGTVAVVGQNVIFTPAAAVNGIQTFTYTVTDSGTPALSATATVTVTLAAVNDAPIAGADAVSTNEDTQLVITAASLLLNDAAGRPTAVATDEANQTLSVTAVSKPAATTGSVTLSGGNITYVPALNFNGTETFTYTVLDSAGATSTGTVTVTVNPINDAPIAGADNVVAFKGVALQIPVADLLGNDVAGPSNELGQTPLTITAVSGAVNGTVSLSNGVVTFTPAAGFSGPASFKYTVQDSGPTGGLNVNSGTGTVNVTVRDFVPTKISGKVWVDDTHDGVVNSAERKLGGVEVTLTGNALGIPITPRTYKTLADGSYHFDNLAPGQYVVQLATPSYFSSEFSADAAGALGDADSIDNQFTINVAQPGGGDGSNYNFAISGLETKYFGLFSSLLASNFSSNGSANSRKGLEAALGDDNSSIWISKLEGFENMVAGEVVVNSAGNRVQLTMVDASERVFTASLSSSQFRVVTDAATGNRLVRIFGDASSINFQQISLAAPPVVSFNRYLEAIDEIFAQEGWDGLV